MTGGDSDEDGEYGPTCRLSSEYRSLPLLLGLMFSPSSLSSPWVADGGTAYSHSNPALIHRRQCGRSSSHFNLRFLQVLHPVRTFGAQVRVRALASLGFAGFMRHCVMKAFCSGCCVILAETWPACSLIFFSGRWYSEDISARYELLQIGVSAVSVV
jgi:hypothetical protein